MIDNYQLRIKFWGEFIKDADLINEVHTCDCCAFPTITELGISEECPICAWVDGSLERSDSGTGSIEQVRINLEEEISSFLKINKRKLHDDSGELFKAILNYMENIEDLYIENDFVEDEALESKLIEERKIFFLALSS